MYWSGGQRSRASLNGRELTKVGMSVSVTFTPSYLQDPILFLDKWWQMQDGHADGEPVAWMLRRFGVPTQTRINGPDLMWRYCAEAAARGEAIYLYGGTPETLQILEHRLEKTFPWIACRWSLVSAFSNADRGRR